MNKSEIRKHYKKLRTEVPPDVIAEKSLEIANNLLKLDIWSYSYYHLFLSITEKKEVDTEPILHVLQGKDKNIVLSAADFKNASLKHYLLTDASVIRKNQFGIPEPVSGIEVPPSQIEVVFVPLLAFDNYGNRVGYGQGFYDRFLAHCPNETIKIGLSIFQAEKQALIPSENDIPLDYCVTPDKIYNFKNL